MTSETDEQFVAQMRWCFADGVSLEDKERYAALARRGAEAGKLLAEQDREYNRKTNALIARHAEQIEEWRKEYEPHSVTPLVALHLPPPPAGEPSDEPV